MLCNEPHRYWPILAQFGHNQGGAGRHKCVGCAYVRGYDDGKAGRPERLDARSLHESQAGTGRHKDVGQAYHDGYLLGQQGLPLRH